jgi:hypothetical protein
MEILCIFVVLIIIIIITIIKMYTDPIEADSTIKKFKPTTIINFEMKIMYEYLHIYIMLTYLITIFLRIQTPLRLIRQSRNSSRL